jgi:hypothetical protein
MGGCGLVGTGSLFIPGAGLFIAAAAGVAGAGLAALATKQNQVAHDPPRDDFFTSTEVAPSTLNLEALGGSPIREPAIALARSADEAARLLDAMITAVERASGAEIAGDANAYGAQLAQAYGFLEHAGDSHAEGALEARRLAGELAPFEGLERTGRTPLWHLVRRRLGLSTLANELPQTIVEELQRMGFSERDLHTRFRMTSEQYPVRALVRDLYALAEANDAYAEYARRSVPERNAFEADAQLGGAAGTGSGAPPEPVG